MSHFASAEVKGEGFTLSIHETSGNMENAREEQEILKQWKKETLPKLEKLKDIIEPILKTRQLSKSASLPKAREDETDLPYGKPCAYTMLIKTNAGTAHLEINFKTLPQKEQLEKVKKEIEQKITSLPT